MDPEGTRLLGGEKTEWIQEPRTSINHRIMITTKLKKAGENK